MLRDPVAKSRDQVMQDLDKQGIETRPVFYPMHVMPPYRDSGTRAFKCADHCSSRGINLPTHALLSDDDVDYIANALDECTR
jgi:perosamine synthetase